MERVRQVPLSLMKCPGKKPAPTHGVNQKTPPFLLPSATESDSKVLPGTEEPLLTCLCRSTWRMEIAWAWGFGIMALGSSSAPVPLLSSLSNLCLLSKPQSPHPAAWQLRSQELKHRSSLRARSPQPPTSWHWAPIQTRQTGISSLGSSAQGAANPSSPRIATPGVLW